MEYTDLPLRVQKFIAVDVGTCCWLWTGHITKMGYGRYDQWITETKSYKGWQAHRWVWHHFGLELPEHLHHKCHVKHCVNPEHLTPTTIAGHNQLHADERTHCKHGHEFTEANTYFRRDCGTRQCRVCKARLERIRQSKWTPEQRSAKHAQGSERRRQRKAALRQSQSQWLASSAPRKPPSEP